MVIRVSLGRLVREQKYVTVEVPDNFYSLSESGQKEIMSAVYEEDSGEGFTPDLGWGVDEDTHCVCDNVDVAPLFRWNGENVETVTSEAK